MTLSDAGAAGERKDISGEVLVEMLAGVGFIEKRDILPDDREAITRTLIAWAAAGLDLVVTTGGTGLGRRDFTPEATSDALDFVVPGMAEAMRAASLAKTPMAMLSRAVIGVRGRTLIINLPGSPKGVRENLAVLLPALPHALEVLRGRGADHVDHGMP